ncbi:TIM barrel protein [Paenibacillus sp. TRM 82003]|nr:TIM barrel protein [Paenibacillus sp. TRM 82003]
MLRSGLLSVTFRQLAPEEIVRLAARAGLSAMEWGGDVHAPPGDEANARRIRAATAEAGLIVASYGSYYRVGCQERNAGGFGPVLRSALALGAPSIRVWAGVRGTDEAGESDWAATIEDAARIADIAAKEGLTIDFEFHGGTLTDTNESAGRLLDALPSPNVRANWQPLRGIAEAYREAGLERVLPRLANVHVYHWSASERLELAEGETAWRRYLKLASQAPGCERYAMLEFVKNDDPDQFLRDAATLKGWLGE